MASSFPKKKTKIIHLCNKRKFHPHPTLYLANQLITVVSKIKFLQVIFDSKLSFKPHIEYLRTKCFKALNLLKIANKQWGADQKSLLTLYRVLIRSKLDYASFVGLYGSARKSYISKLEPIANQALRLCLGAFRTSPTTSLQILCHEPPLELRRNELALKYTLKLQANPIRLLTQSSQINHLAYLLLNTLPSHL